MFQSLRFELTFNRLLQLLVLGYQTLAILAFVIAIILASSWLQVPFLGAFFEQTLVANGATPSQPSEAWQLHNQGITLGEQLTSVFGNTVTSESDIRNVLINFSPGETIPVTTQSPKTGTKSYDVTLHKFPSADRDAYFIIPMFVSAAFLAISFWIFGLRRSESAGRAFTLFAASLAIIAGALFDLFTTHRLTYLWTFAMAIAGGALVDLTLTFPQEARVLLGRPYFRWTGYFIALILFGFAVPTINDFSQPTSRSKNPMIKNDEPFRQTKLFF